jgi:integrase
VIARRATRRASVVHPDDLVFASMQSNAAIHQVAFLRNHFKPARDKALPDHPNLRFLDRRHTFVSLLIAQSVNVNAIAAQAGHSSTAFTLDVYGHLMPGSNDELRAALSAAWTSATQQKVLALRATG